MGQADKKREVLVCQWVADGMNEMDGTDYRAVPYSPDPPDVLLISDSGKHATREAEVVSTPQDFTIRYDNKNVRKFERRLRLALQQLGFSNCNLLVYWSDSAVRFGVEDPLIFKLAEIIVATASRDDYLFLRGVEIYKHSPEVSRVVHYARVFRLSYPTLEVHSASGCWLPGDGRWIEEAVATKRKKYGSGTVASKLMLVVDGLFYLDPEQVEAFRHTAAPEQVPFAELWVVTMGRAYRVKP